MSARSHYAVTCLCGQPVKGETKDLHCSECGLAITVEWPCSTRIEVDGTITRGEESQ
jgi:hypothetical protein